MDLKDHIDHHFHFKFEEEEKQLELLKEAFAGGLSYALEAGTGLEGFERRLELAQRFKNHLYLTAGIHPEYGKPPFVWTNSTRQTLLQQLNQKEVVALGEIGLDYSYNIEKDQQQQLFAHQLELVKEVGKPVMLHLRDAHEDALALIREQGIENGVVHCFTGDKATAKQWLDQNFHLSFSGIVTFKNAAYLKESAVYCPLDRLFCETDAPWLAPVPHRGQPNQVSYVAYVYQEIEKLKGLPLSNLVAKVKENFLKLYGLA